MPSRELEIFGSVGKGRWILGGILRPPQCPFTHTGPWWWRRVLVMVRSTYGIWKGSAPCRTQHDIGVGLVRVGRSKEWWREKRRS